MTRATVTEAPAGALRTEAGATAAIRFERLYDSTPEELWSALTDPEQLSGWLAGVRRLELEPGGTVELEFDGGPPARCSVREVVPGRVLELDWREEGEQPSIVRFEVVPRDAGALLVLDHRLVDAPSAPGYGAGWQGHLEALDALLAGAPAVDHHARYHALRPLWEEQRSELARGLGVVRPDGEQRALAFERRLAAPPERVWRALTDRAELTCWLTDVTIEPQLGGAVVIDFGADGSVPGTVLTWEPPRVLEYSWLWAGVHDSVLRFELRADGDGTHLRMEHRAVSARVAGDHGSGWHAYLDALADVVEGRPVGSWDEREVAHRPHYERRAAAL